MRLATYFWLAVVLGAACAAIGWLGLPGWLATAVLVASVAMHVAGNAIGTRLRDETDLRLERVPRTAPAIPPLRPTRLASHASLGRLVPVCTAIGGICGGTAGACGLAAFTQASVAGSVLGGVSSAVIGGLLGFLVASFLEVVRASLREAVAAERRG